VLALVISAAVALQDPLPAWELELTDRINAAPDAVATALYPVMQLGTLAAPILVGAAIIGARRDVALGLATMIAGLVTWFGAKLIKRLVERDRPLTYLPEIAVREGDGAGLGYLSGHSSVAACSAVCAMAVLPRPWRPVAAFVAALVGIARIVHGVHLPADVVGGWAFGTLIGLATLAVVDRLQPAVARRDRPDREELLP
jgi:undecaprenyl-diphosphatase